MKNHICINTITNLGQKILREFRSFVHQSIVHIIQPPFPDLMIRKEVYSKQIFFAQPKTAMGSILRLY